MIRKAAESVSYIDEASEPIRKVLVEGYIKGIEYGHGKYLSLYQEVANKSGLSILFSGITLVTALLLKERKL